MCLHPGAGASLTSLSFSAGRAPRPPSFVASDVIDFRIDSHAARSAHASSRRHLLLPLVRIDRHNSVRKYIKTRCHPQSPSSLPPSLSGAALVLPVASCRSWQFPFSLATKEQPVSLTSSSRHSPALLAQAPHVPQSKGKASRHFPGTWNDPGPFSRAPGEFGGGRPAPLSAACAPIRPGTLGHAEGVLGL